MSQQPGILPPSMALVVRADDGDTFESIAAQFGCELDRLRRANPDVHSVSKGSELVVPLQIVQCMAEEGDTLDSIAEQFKVPVSRLSAANPGVRTVTPGTVLIIP